MSLTTSPRAGTAVPTRATPTQPAPGSQRPSTSLAPTGFRHEGAIWSGATQLLERTLPFVLGGLDAGDAIVVALWPHNEYRVRTALGRDAARVRFVDPDAQGRSPARRLQGWLGLLARACPVSSTHDADIPPGSPRAPFGRVRVVTESVRCDQRAAEISEVHLHEALLNVAIPAMAPLSVMCLYDAGAVTTDVLAGACRTHPVMSGAGAGAPVYEGPDYARRLGEAPLPEPAGTLGSLDFTAGGLSLVRHRVARVAAAHGVPAARVDDLTVAVNEVAANSLDHGGGRGVLRYWSEPGAVVFEVHDDGYVTDPLVGLVSPESGQARGRGLWMAHQFGDLLQLRSSGTGTTARVTTWV